MQIDIGLSRRFRALLQICRALLRIYRVLLRIYRVLLRMYRAFLRIRAVLRIYHPVDTQGLFAEIFCGYTGL